MTASETGKLALLWPRDTPKWNAKTPQDDRLHRVFEAMAALGIEAEPAIYADDVADQVRQQLLRCDGVLAWVDPLFAGQNRIVLDALLRDVASKGVWVSAHPDVILKMGREGSPSPHQAFWLGHGHPSVCGGAATPFLKRMPLSDSAFVQMSVVRGRPEITCLCSHIRF